MKFNILCGQYFESDKKLLPLMQIACVAPPPPPPNIHLHEMFNSAEVMCNI